MPLKQIGAWFICNESNDVTLDLQVAFTGVYDAIGFDLLLNYTTTPDVPIEDATQAEWAAALLEKARQS